jgi:hypothetical protein
MGLKWGGLAPQSTRIIEKQPLRQQRSCARWVFPQPVRLVTDADGVAMLVPVIDSSVREAEVSNIH